MRVVVGLGNPGERYARTPHNVGFAVVDRMAEELGGAWRRSARFEASLGRVALHGEPVLLAKPETFMNNSGASVAAILRYHAAQASDLVLVLDDADLERGRLRIRPGGSSGGHRGLESVIQHVRTNAFARLRIGIGRGADAGDLVDHVLQAYTAREWAAWRPVIETGARGVMAILEVGVAEAMNRFNGLPSPFAKTESNEGE